MRFHDLNLLLGGSFQFSGGWCLSLNSVNHAGDVGQSLASDRLSDHDVNFMPESFWLTTSLKLGHGFANLVPLSFAQWLPFLRFSGGSRSVTVIAFIAILVPARPSRAVSDPPFEYFRKRCIIGTVELRLIELMDGEVDECC